MRILLRLHSDAPLELPMNYQEYLIGFMYKNIRDKKYRSFLHNEGYTFQGKTYKHFAFSRLLGPYRYNRSRKTITFAPAFSLMVTSPLDHFVQEFAQSMLRSDELQIGQYRVYLNSFETLPEPNPFPDTLRIRMLSPIVTYSTLRHPNGAKYTYYYSPHQEQFSSMIEANLKRRYFSMHPDENDNELARPLSIVPCRVDRRHKVVTRFHGVIIEGWMGEYEISGDLRLLRWAFHSNLGNKGSQGCGVFECID
jgi:CRISPR-associated endoribonuclease Cas6